MTPFEISDSLVRQTLALSPMVATNLGVAGSDHRWDDLSPDGLAALRDMFEDHRRMLEAHVDHADPDQRHAAQVLSAYLEERIGYFDSGEHLRDISHIYCGFTRIRDLFDIMPRDSAVAWSNIASRLQSLGEVLAGWRATLTLGIGEGKVAARRQVESIIEQAQNLAGDESMIVGLLAQADEMGFGSEELEAAGKAARQSVAEIAEWLAGEYLPHADDADGVGPDRYLRSAERFLGLVIDPVELYAWGWEEIGRLQGEMEVVAAVIDPDASVNEVIALLETDSSRVVHRDEFPEFVQRRLEQAVVELDGVHFDVPDPIKPITVSLAPPGGSLGAWYVNPSADWERPGSVWYSVGSRQQIPVWQEVSTAYHEGFPGHHLQVSTAMYQADHLSEAQRLFVWYPGYGEGWALYAERLMDELGYFELPEYRLGMLASHIFRAVRVVVDIGCHLGYAIPRGAPLHPGAEWSYERAVDYIAQVGLQPPEVAESEVKRYLGWPGQAIAYKVGEREILDIRARLQSADRDFELVEFHRRVLSGGAVRLDHLRRRLLAD